MGWQNHSSICSRQIQRKAKQGAWCDGKEKAQQLPPSPGCSCPKPAGYTPCRSGADWCCLCAVGNKPRRWEPGWKERQQKPAEGRLDALNQGTVSSSWLPGSFRGSFHLLPVWSRPAPHQRAFIWLYKPNCWVLGGGQERVGMWSPWSSCWIWGLQIRWTTKPGAMRLLISFQCWNQGSSLGEAISALALPLWWTEHIYRHPTHQPTDSTWTLTCSTG